MESRTLRSRTVETERDIQSSPAGESTSTSSTEPQGNLGSVSETVGPTPIYPQEQELAEQTETVSTQAEMAKTSDQGPLPSATTQLEQMLASFMTAMQQNNVQLRADLHSAQGSIRVEVNSVRSDLGSNQEKLEKLQESIKADILNVQENLLSRFDQQTQKLRNEFNSKLDAESR